MFKRIFIFFVIGLLLHNYIRNDNFLVFIKNPYSELYDINIKDKIYIDGNEQILVSRKDTAQSNSSTEDENYNSEEDENTKETSSDEKLKDWVSDFLGSGIKKETTPIKKEENSLTNNISSQISIDKIKSNLSDNSKVIGCINKSTYETLAPKNGSCISFGKGVWLNIALPPKSHIDKWENIFKNANEIIDFFPIVNLESSFNENAKLYVFNGKYYKNAPYDGADPFVWGYVQTKYSYGVSNDVKSQLNWLKNRSDSQLKGNCSQRKDSGRERLLRCLYARHHGDNNGYNWYPSFNISVRNYYINYFLK